MSRYSQLFRGIKDCLLQYRHSLPFFHTTERGLPDLLSGFRCGEITVIISIRDHPYSKGCGRMLSPETREKIGPVLGQVPSGVYILVAGNEAGQKTGLLASWIQQASFEPPQVTVAVNKSRYLNEWLKVESPLTLNQVAKGDNSLFKHFGKGFEPDVEAFEGVDSVPAANGLPMLTSAVASMEGKIASQIEAGDHVIYLVDITSATSHSDAPDVTPFVHIRKNGFNY
jgi:flavin reductase (DIM6/NTAB) family NADH-FMN oxidoreductase RutF